MTGTTTQRICIEIDATDQAVGRVASQAVVLLRGKHKAGFDPAKITGDCVRIINAGKVKFTGKKLEQKDFYRHTMYRGGLTRTPVKRVFEKNPRKVIEHAIYGMLPKNRQRGELMKRVIVEA